MSAHVFVDTNVLLYARDASEPAKQPRAAAWLALLWRQRTGRTSTQVLSEFYVNATRKLRPGLRPEDAWDDVRAFLTWRPQPLDASVLTAGRELERRYRLSWWDSLVVAAAQAQRCAVLLTEDLQDGVVYGDVTVRSPFTLGVDEGTAKYAVPRSASGHRSRGRPPK